MWYKESSMLCHTALSPVQFVHLLEYVVLFQSMRGCYAWETDCNTLHYVMPIATMRLGVMPIATMRMAVNQVLKTTKINLVAIIFNNIKKELFLKHFLDIFQAFAMKIYVCWVINLLPPVCSHAIQKILMIWVCISWGWYEPKPLIFSCIAWTNRR